MFNNREKEVKKIISLLFVVMYTANLTADTEIKNYWDRLNSFDYDGFHSEYENLGKSTETLSNIKKGKLAYALFYTGDQKLDWLEIAVKNISHSIDQVEISEKEKAELSFILAESCFNLIVDAPSYFEYGEIYEKSIVRCLELEPENPDYKVSSALSMMRLPTPRGSADDGKALLSQLEKDYPGNVSVLMAVSDNYFRNGDIEKAEAGYKAVLKTISNHKIAIAKLYDIDLGRKELEIRNIYVSNNIKTSESRVLKKVSSFIGTKFNFNTKREIYSRLTEIPSISGVEVKGIQIDDRIVDLEIEVGENNMRALMFICGVTLGFDYDGDLDVSGIPAVAYIDNNFMGTANKLMVMTAGIFNKIDLTCPGIINDGFVDFKLSLTSMALAMEDDVHIYGKKAYKTKQTYHGFQVGLGRELPIGLSAFGYYESMWTLNNGIDGHTFPDYQQTHTVSGEFIFSTAGEQFSAFQQMNGITVGFYPEWIYKSEYKEWGKDGLLFEHNDSPAYKFKTHLGYYTDTLSNQNIEIDAKWLASENPYHSTLFKIGTANGPMDTETLSGYIPGEVVFENGILTNIKYNLTLIDNKLKLYGKYDLLYNIDEKEFLNGCAIGAAIKLPFDIDMVTEAGFGLDAERESGIGYEFSVLFTKMLVL